MERLSPTVYNKMKARLLVLLHQSNLLLLALEGNAEGSWVL